MTGILPSPREQRRCPNGDVCGSDACESVCINDRDGGPATYLITKRPSGFFTDVAEQLAAEYDARITAPTALRDLTSAERKAAPVWAGVLLYFPDALMAVARVSKKGNDKHNPGEPLHWARGKSMDQEDCVVRHLLTPNAIDKDSGESEYAHAAWRALAALQLVEEQRLVAAGIAPMSGHADG